jgi:hypothetical protein
MRVTTELFVSALVRRAFIEGGFAAIMRKGAAEAGAVFVIARGRDGQVRLFGPAPQTSYETGKPEERRFAPLLSDRDETLVNERLEREIRFDPDVWIVELETAGPAEALLEVTTP